MVFIEVLNLILVVLIVVAAFSEVFLPVITGKPMFPTFRWLFSKRFREARKQASLARKEMEVLGMEAEAERLRRLAEKKRQELERERIRGKKKPPAPLVEANPVFDSPTQANPAAESSDVGSNEKPPAA